MKTFGRNYVVAKVVRAYHGSNVPVKKFDKKFTNQGFFWFSESKEKILAGKSGARSSKYIIVADLDVDKTAGWPEYNKHTIGELKGRGYDSVRLESKEGADWIVFDPKRIKIVQVEETKNETKADSESFVHRVRHKYDTVDKDAIDKKLTQDRDAMSTENFQTWGYPPGIYWKERDQEERAKEIWRKERSEEDEDKLELS